MGDTLCARVVYNSMYRIYKMANSDVTVIYKLRDCNAEMVTAWSESFKDYSDRVEISLGNIVTDVLEADAFVSPADSYGWMKGGVDKVYCTHFGFQLQNRLQEIIRSQYDGELLVGQAIIMPSFEGDSAEPEDRKGSSDNRPIKLLISAPTVRVPCNVAATAHAYLAFRAVILAVKKYNADKANQPIRTVLCPGLATGAGEMPPRRCAYQMQRAYEVYELGLHPQLKKPTFLQEVWGDHYEMVTHGKKEEMSPPESSSPLYLLYLELI